MVKVPKVAFNLQIIIKAKISLKYYESEWVANQKIVKA